MKYKEYKELNIKNIDKEILDFWEKENIFKKSITSRSDTDNYIFYEGPPSANGMPGIHHVISRTIKDIVCRYKTLKGMRVERKAGWDTHGLPVELSVEQSLGIKKEDIGTRISIEEYNSHCRREVMKYTREWEELTRKMGYWINMEQPYITCDNRYIETLWYLLGKLYEKGLLYKGYTIQPYSPAAGTGLSTHELNQPGCYRDVKDTSCIAQFMIKKDGKSEHLYKMYNGEIFILAWTTTPWTLPSNTALAVGKDITYCMVQTTNQYTEKEVCVILAKELLPKYFDEKKDNYYKLLCEINGSELEGMSYHQLIEWVRPDPSAFCVVAGDFVSTEEGTGIVHIAPTFGADDFRVARQNNIPALLIKDVDGNSVPLVDKKGRFYTLEQLDPAFIKESVNVDQYSEFSGRYVKNEYDDSISGGSTTDIDICVKLKKENKAFKIEKYVHSYPHCWRTDKPVLYYPLDSWFIKTTVFKERLIELNNTINWKPEATGFGRFGKWLENLVDWNLSRSRFWGTPLPIWSSEDKKEFKCISSVSELKAEADKAVNAGFMKSNPLGEYVEGDLSAANYNTFDLHRPFVDNILLVSSSGQKMYREPDLIDVWFDSGAMPYAQVHYPFAINDESLSKVFPADFIAEGVDQTRGWFFTLHALSTLLFDNVSFKNIISNGLVLDKNGNKMSKRLGNAVNPFDVIEKYGADPLRWYMITNAQPWDNLKFDTEGIDEVQRKFFGTLYNTYSFFALYANIDGFTYTEEQVPMKERTELDRWIISLKNTLVEKTGECYENYDFTGAGRLIQDFVMNDISNWYVRLNRKRFWGGTYGKDKIAAYQTLYDCLMTVAKVTSPIAPFFMERLFADLNKVTNKEKDISVHLTSFPVPNTEDIDVDLEERMEMAQTITSMVLGLRRKVNIKVRQPLSKIMIPVIHETFVESFEYVKNIVLSEVNVKEVEYFNSMSGMLVKKIKPDFKKLGPRFGKNMKAIALFLSDLDQNAISQFEIFKQFKFNHDGHTFEINIDDVEIMSEDIPGCLVANEGKYTVALDVNLTAELINEGIARELVNRIQNIRKESSLEVTDKITIHLQEQEETKDVIAGYEEYICTQTLAKEIIMMENITDVNKKTINIGDGIETNIIIHKYKP